ncbi:MAG: PEGA domain-containing protein [bacterium]
MTKKTRSVLFIFFIILFLTISPLMVVYAFGFKFNLDQMRFQKTSMFIIDTEPTGAKIYIDGKPEINALKFYSPTDRYARTPTKIKNIIPGEHNIRIELDGYWEWEKNLIVNPGETVYIEDVRLFEKNLPLILSAQTKGSLKAIKLAPNKENIAMINNEQLTIFDLAKEKEIISIKIPAKAEELSWSIDSKKIIINTAVFDIGSEKFINLAELTEGDPHNLKWNGNSNIVFYQNNSGIHSFNLNNEKSTRLNTAKIDDYLIKGNELFYLSTNSQNTILSIYNLAGQKDVGQIELVKADYTFINPDNKWINLYNQNNQKLYLLEVMYPWDNKYNQKKIENIKTSTWAGDTLFYNNDFEIKTWDSRDNSTTLLTRVSDRILNLIWHPSNNYIIYHTDKSINTLELDKRETHNINVLINPTKTMYSELNQQGNILYFYAEIGNQSGLYKLEI